LKSISGHRAAQRIDAIRRWWANFGFGAEIGNRHRHKFHARVPGRRRRAIDQLQIPAFTAPANNQSVSETPISHAIPLHTDGMRIGPARRIVQSAA